MGALVLLAALLQAVPPPAPARVLFVGNSFTFRNDLPGLVAELGRSLEPPVPLEVGMIARDGMTLERHWQDGEVVRRLREERWDLLVLQEQSARPLGDPGRTERDLRRFAAAARNAGAGIILFETWARADQPETEAPRAEVHRRLARAAGARLAPVGAAWALARAELPGVGLHADDGLHANRTGTYLAAAVLLGVIAGRSPEQARAPSSGDPDSAAALRALAWRAVRAVSGADAGSTLRYDREPEAGCPTSSSRSCALPSPTGYQGSTP